MVIKATYYICNKDPRKPCLADGRVCYSDGFEECYKTTDPKYALNGECKDPENHPERFKESKHDYEGDTYIYYEERRDFV